MHKRIFKLRTPILAIHAENDARRIVIIPENALVMLVVGDIDVAGFVQIRFADEPLLIFAEDLRTRGERVMEASV